MKDLKYNFITRLLIAMIDEFELTAEGFRQLSDVIYSALLLAEEPKKEEKE